MLFWYISSSLFIDTHKVIIYTGNSPSLLFFLFTALQNNAGRCWPWIVTVLPLNILSGHSIFCFVLVCFIMTRANIHIWPQIIPHFFQSMIEKGKESLTIHFLRKKKHKSSNDQLGGLSVRSVTVTYFVQLTYTATHHQQPRTEMKKSNWAKEPTLNTLFNHFVLNGQRCEKTSLSQMSCFLGAVKNRIRPWPVVTAV